MCGLSALIMFLATGSVVAQSASPSCHLFPGLVLGSGQLTTLNQPSADSCCSACGNVPNCAAWTWHSDVLSCYLKDNARPATGKPSSTVTSGLHPGPTCTPKQKPSMCPGGKACPDCNGPICPCAFDPAAHPTPAPNIPLTPACTPPHDKYAFCNTTLSIEARVADLITYIKDEQKPNLLTARGGPSGLQNLSAVGVPAYYWGTNCLHSVGAPCTHDGHCATNFPSGPSMAATFDRALVRSIAVSRLKCSN
jgi:hypothetical protein